MTQKQNIKAELKIVLQANNTIVAESSDPILWQKVLASINAPPESAPNNSIDNANQINVPDLLSPKGPLDKMAKEIGISIDVLKGACDPSNSTPFIHLDKHHWEAMKKATPLRGPNSISPIILSATMLILWKEKAKLGDATIKEAQEALDTLGLYDKHANRSLSNCEWLQLRGKNVIINPSQTSKAITFARSYCTKEWKQS